MIKSITDYTILNNGIKMPWLGYGVFQIDDGPEINKAINKALEVGYRSIDTANFYGNEKWCRESGWGQIRIIIIFRGGVTNIPF